MIIRNYTWADLSALAALTRRIREAGGSDSAMSTSSLKEELGQPGLAPEENCTLFEHKEALVAYSVLHPELRIGRAVLELVIHPTHAEGAIEAEAVRAGLARATSLEARVLHMCVHPSEFWEELLKGKGFALVRRYLLMRWNGEEVSPVNLREGFAIETFRTGDEERLTQVQNASFGGNWGFCPNTVEEVRYRAGMSMSSPEGILFLAHGDETAGYCWTCITGAPENPIGVIGMIGIAPAYRGQGLSRPILLAGMGYLHSRGVSSIRLDVDGENQPAIGLYTSVGFNRTMELHWFEARLSEGGDCSE